VTDQRASLSAVELQAIKDERAGSVPTTPVLSSADLDVVEAAVLHRWREVYPSVPLPVGVALALVQQARRAP